MTEEITILIKDKTLLFDNKHINEMNIDEIKEVKETFHNLGDESNDNFSKNIFNSIRFQLEQIFAERITKLWYKNGGNEK